MRKKIHFDQSHTCRYDASVKSGEQIYACNSSSFCSSVWRGKMPKCHQNPCLRSLLPFSWDDDDRSTHCGCHSPRGSQPELQRSLIVYEQWFVRTFQRKAARKVAMAAFVDVLCINMPLYCTLPIILTILGWSNFIITSASCIISDWKIIIIRKYFKSVVQDKICYIHCTIVRIKRLGRQLCKLHNENYWLCTQWDVHVTQNSQS